MCQVQGGGAFFGGGGGGGVKEKRARKSTHFVLNFNAKRLQCCNHLLSEVTICDKNFLFSGEFYFICKKNLLDRHMLKQPCLLY